MVIVKLIKCDWNDVDKEKYVGKIYDAIKLGYRGCIPVYYVQVDNETIYHASADEVEEIDDRPMLACAEEQPIKKITMQDIVESLGITVGDIVQVNAYGNKNYIKCSDKFDLAWLNGNHDARISSLILGMVSGKHDYTVYSKRYECVQTERR